MNKSGTGTEISNRMNTLSEVLSDLRQKGVETDLRIDARGRLRFGDDPESFQPQDVRLIWTRRFEGQSNPGDLSVLYGLKLPDGRTGVLVDGYGPSSSPANTIFIRAVPTAGPANTRPR